MCDLIRKYYAAIIIGSESGVYSGYFLLWLFPVEITSGWDYFLLRLLLVMITSCCECFISYFRLWLLPVSSHAGPEAAGLCLPACNECDWSTVWKSRSGIVSEAIPISQFGKGLRTWDCAFQIGRVSCDVCDMWGCPESVCDVWGCPGRVWRCAVWCVMVPVIRPVCL